MNSLRRILLTASILAAGAAAAPVASAAAPIRLVLSQGAAFSIVGHSCGGIQEEVWATGFAPDGYPQGTAYLSTRCGGSGRGGGYKTTTYSGWATVVWDWLGNTHSFAAGSEEHSPTFEATDAHGDRIYNSGSSAFLETGEPPYRAPAAPTGVSASVVSVELSEEEEEPTKELVVSWTPDPEVAGMITSSRVTATPVESAAPVLSGEVTGDSSQMTLLPAERHTTYSVIVTSTDDEGISEPSTPVEVTVASAGEGGGGEGGQPSETCEQAAGTIKLSPGLTEAPHVQSVTVKGQLSGCDGPLPIEAAGFVAHLTSDQELTCSALVSFSLEAGTTSQSFAVKWSPRDAGSSSGALVLPISEYPYAGVGGSLEGGPFEAPVALSSGALTESYAGGSSCGVASGKRKAKAVKSGTFSAGDVTFE